ncbi:hypothetical protein LO763_17215 [Glycomyces sp. A-F 0318]|uniref:hypothetical protein n=1 Tax=Glycomyces amatae TaxID=2881355 RepID=UPI001E4116A4|nr:hypothetical protein [Glycomyces amatae]MCD0445356.1 hypothetical protein [Glycomyces amatae]
MTSLDRRQFHRSLLAVPAAALVGTGLGALAPAAASAAPADWQAQFLVGQADGELMHRRRRGDGSWGPTWDGVPTATGALLRVSCAGMSADLHVVATINSGTPDHAVRRGSDGSWTAFTPIPSQSGPASGAVHVAATTLGRELHVFSASERGTTLYHTVRGEDGVWLPRWTALRTFGRIGHIATARVGTTISTTVIADGRLLHAVRASDGTWSTWGDVERPAGDIGNVNQVALAGIGAQLHVVALNGSSEVHHAIRKGDGSWQRFRKPSVFNGHSPFAVCAANVGGEMQVGIIDLDGSRQIVKHSIRRSDGSWQRVGTVSSAGLTGDPGTLAVAATR